MYLLIVLCYYAVMLVASEQLEKNVSYTEDAVPLIVNGWPGKAGDVPYQVGSALLDNKGIEI